MKSLDDASTTTERVGRDDCLRLLAEDNVGRLAVIAGGSPHIFPVNYALDGESIVFRTDEGTKLHAQGRGRACFEIDEIDRERHSGWSVVASGRLEEVTHHDARTLHRVNQLPVEPWAGGDKAHVMRLIPDRITGRRVSA